MKVVYESFDGVLFEVAEECLAHEKSVFSKIAFYDEAKSPMIIKEEEDLDKAVYIEVKALDYEVRQFFRHFDECSMYVMPDVDEVGFYKYDEDEGWLFID